MKKTLRDKDIEVAMGSLLRGGVILSSIIVLFGGIIYIYRHGSEMPEYRTFNEGNSIYHTVKNIFKGVFAFKGKAIIQLGILVLIATPIARIIFSLVGFLIEKDYLYVAITFIVLTIIIGSLVMGVHP